MPRDREARGDYLVDGEIVCIQDVPIAHAVAPPKVHARDAVFAAPAGHEAMAFEDLRGKSRDDEHVCRHERFSSLLFHRRHPRRRLRLARRGTRVDFDRVHTSEIVLFAIAVLLPVGGGGILFYFVSRAVKKP